MSLVAFSSVKKKVVTLKCRCRATGGHRERAESAALWELTCARADVLQGEQGSPGLAGQKGPPGPLVSPPPPRPRPRQQNRGPTGPSERFLFLNALPVVLLEC